MYVRIEGAPAHLLHSSTVGTGSYSREVLFCCVVASTCSSVALDWPYLLRTVARAPCPHPLISHRRHPQEPPLAPVFPRQYHPNSLRPLRPHPCPTSVPPSLLVATELEVPLTMHMRVCTCHLCLPGGASRTTQQVLRLEWASPPPAMVLLLLVVLVPGTACAPRH